MAANEPVGHSESENTSSYKYVKKRVAQMKIKWRIDEFETMMTATEPGEGDLWSPGNSSELVPRAIWKLHIYPNGKSDEEKSNIGLYLHLSGPMADNKESLGASYHLYFINGTGGKISVGERDTDNFGREHHGWGWDASHDEVRKALHADGSLMVAADIDFFVPDDGALQCDADLQWPTKFSELHGDPASSDCTFEIGGVSIPAHKFVLISCSPMFRTMFTGLSAKSESDVIKIHDLEEAEPMQALIRYCYQGFLDDTTMDGKGAVEIFQLADKYLIDDLKAQLEKHFINKRLSVGNVIEMAVLADAHSAEKLMEACIELIVREGNPIFESAGWKELREEDPKLTTDLAVEAFRVLNQRR